MSCEKPDTVTISNLPHFSTLVTGPGSFRFTTCLYLTNLPEFKTFTTQWNSFGQTTKLYLSNIPFNKGNFIRGIYNGPLSDCFPAFYSLKHSEIISDSGMDRMIVY